MKESGVEKRTTEVRDKTEGTKKKVMKQKASEENERTKLNKNRRMSRKRWCKGKGCSNAPEHI